MLWDSDGESPDDGVAAEVFNCGDVEHGKLNGAESHARGE